MGMLAVITVTDHIGQPHRHRSAWASPEYQIPQVAKFLTWTDQTHLPLSVDTYLRSGTDAADTQPTEVVTHAYADENTRSDLDYRYHLTLNPDRSDLTLGVRHLRRRRRRDRLVATTTRAAVYEAARMCDQVTYRCQYWSDSNDGHHLSGDNPQRWHAATVDLRRQQPTAATIPTASATAAAPAAPSRPSGWPRRCSVAGDAGRRRYRTGVTGRYITVHDISHEQYDGLAIDHLRRHRLTFEETLTVRHEPVPDPDRRAGPGGTAR